MRELTKRIDWCSGHRLLEYDGECKFVHGHNYRADITFAGNALTAAGFVIDFGDIKDPVKGWIDSHWDHAFLVSRHDAVLRDWLAAQGQKHFVVEGATVSAANPTAENLVKILWKVALPIQAAHNAAHEAPIRLAKVRLYETDSSWCEYSE